MFDIGWGELVVIGVVALIAIGPKELPTVLRSLGQYMGKVRRMAAEFQGQFQEALREAEVADLKKQAEDLTSSVTDFASFDPMADMPKDEEEEEEEESAVATPEPEPSAIADASAEAANEMPASEPATPELQIDTPEPAAPVTEQDLAPADVPPPKQAGGGA
jgi:sec-independent protein translocase protein TatB